MRLSFLLALLLAACQAETPTSTSSPEPEVESGAPLPDAALIEDVSITQTTDLVVGFADASPSIAIQTLALWSSRLDTLALEGDLADTLASLQRDIEMLQGELQSSPLVGRPIGTTLRSMGRRTKVLAGSREDISALGDALAAAGRVLAPSAPDSSRVSTDEESPVQ